MPFGRSSPSAAVFAPDSFHYQGTKPLILLQLALHFLILSSKTKPRLFHSKEGEKNPTEHLMLRNEAAATTTKVRLEKSHRNT